MTHFPNHSPTLNKKHRKNFVCARNYYVNLTPSKTSIDRQAKMSNKFAYLLDTSPDPNYNEIEAFIIDLTNKGYDLIDILILAREQFNTEKLDSYLYEMRDKGII